MLLFAYLDEMHALQCLKSDTKIQSLTSLPGISFQFSLLNWTSIHRDTESDLGEFMLHCCFTSTVNI